VSCRPTIKRRYRQIPPHPLDCLRPEQRGFLWHEVEPAGV
jgi:hypothetical protein